MKGIYRAILAILLFMVFQGMGGIMAYAGQSIWRQSPSSAMALGLIISGLTTIGILYALRLISTQTFLPHAISWGHASIAFTASLLGIFAMDLLSEQLHLRRNGPFTSGHHRHSTC